MQSIRDCLQFLLADESIQLSNLKLIQIARDCAFSLNWLHSSNSSAIHGDVNAAAFLVDASWRVKLGDFQSANSKVELSSVVDGSIRYAAPEVLKGEKPSRKSDVYSFGILLWHIITRHEPFEEMNDISITDFHKHVINGYRPTLQELELPPRLSNLIQKCWSGTSDQRPSFPDILGELELIVIDVAISNEEARAFWRESHFKDNVSWPNFLTAFLKDIGVQLPSSKVYDEHSLGAVLAQDKLHAVHCLKAVLASQQVTEGVVIDPHDLSKLFVNIERFGKVIDWFGPIKYPKNPFCMLNKVQMVLSSSNWFHGDISTSEAEKLLEPCQPGTFLVRFSSNIPGYFTISTKFADRIQHQRVEHEPCTEEYQLEIDHKMRTFKSLHEVVIKEGKRLNLLTPCPGSKYAYLSNMDIAKKLRGVYV